MTDADVQTGGRMHTTDDGAEDVARAAIDDCVVSAHRTAPGRIVLTDHDSVDAWIASSLTLDCRR